MTLLSVNLNKIAVLRNSRGGKVVKVRQSGTQLALDLESGTTYAITTAEETSSVMVRDRNHALEYAD